jgi:hypothetical protein
MSCCGGRRAAASAIADPRPAVTFEYRGQTALTVVGTATRKLYWFSEPGARVDIHARDAESLDGVQHLRRVPLGH